MLSICRKASKIMEDTSVKRVSRKRALPLAGEAKIMMPIQKRVCSVESDSQSAKSSATGAEEKAVLSTRHNEEDDKHSRVRAQISECIESRLDHDDVKCRKVLATAMEKRLYDNAPSFEEYADMSTLNSRLRVAAMSILSRRQLKKRSKESRQVILEAKLGKSMYERLCSLVKAVLDLRSQVGASLGCRTCCETNLDIPAGEKMPSAVRNLFYHTQLVESFRSSPIELLHCLDWGVMIEQARNIVEDFQEWSGLHTAP